MLETARLALRKLTAADAPFFLELLNSPGWLEFIGDRDVHSVGAAEKYLLDGPIKSYSEHGFGMMLVELRATGEAIGSCGLIQRDFLDGPDIGFAFLPEFFGMGYAFEAAEAVMGFAKNELGQPRIAAFTDKTNFFSIKLLKKLGFQLEKLFDYPKTNEELLLLSNAAPPNDPLEIDILAHQFFSVFDNTGGKKPKLGLLKNLCAEAVIFTKNLNGQPETSNLENFTAPREVLLNGGGLTGFSEKETSATTQIFGHIAQRFSFYEKSGTGADGRFFEKKGAKSLQFLQSGGFWKISAVAWDDEPD